MKKWKASCSNCDAQPILADYTPTLMKIPFSVCRLKKLWPEAKIVLLLRDPVERSISQYLMDVRYGWTEGKLMG